MITIKGHQYGTAQEIAARLGSDITADRIRDWARRSRNPHDRLHGRLPRHRVQGLGVRYRLDQAAAVEKHTRTSTRGRKRRET
jgi:hypothetical protein